MPTKPQNINLKQNTIDILNAIRNNASTDYKDFIPEITMDQEQVRVIGDVLATHPRLQNEFLTALMNRIGMVIITSKMFHNPLVILKKGYMEVGETVEEIFTNLINVHKYDPAVAENELYKREIPDVRSAFHLINYKKFYKVTVTRVELLRAFTTISGVVDMITRLINQMYTSASYDEFVVTKYLLQRNILNGRLKPVQVPTLNKANASEIVSTIKGVSNSIEFMKTDYNIAGVHTASLKENQCLIVNSNFDAVINVEVLASAFNMDKAEFLAHKLMIDSFGVNDTQRLEMLMENEPVYKPITPEESAMLDKIPAVLCDKDWFMIYDALMEMSEEYNPEGLYWNYFLHNWKIFSVSPFMNSAVFVADKPKVTKITVSPTSADVKVGQILKLGVNVMTENFAPQTVKFESDNPEKVKISVDGSVTVLKSGTIKITAKSTFDDSKTAVCTITATE